MLEGPSSKLLSLLKMICPGQLYHLRRVIFTFGTSWPMLARIVMRQPPGNDLQLGQLAGRNASLGFPRTERDKHLYVCGGTGTGKSKFLENLIRQDIRNWHKS